jgi:hypothetical protein
VLNPVTERLRSRVCVLGAIRLSPCPPGGISIRVDWRVLGDLGSGGLGSVFDGSGVMSVGRSSSLPLWKTAPARPAGLRGVDELVGHGNSGRP